MPRVVTYNVHRCLGTDGVLSTSRIARVLASCEPDVVALQELDVGRRRSGGVDQASEIAAELGMRMHFHPTLKAEDELYGDAVLSRWPMRLMKAGALPSHPRRTGGEPRGALWVKIDIDGGCVDLINTHLGLFRQERLAQVEALLGREWLLMPECGGALLLVGDFNAPPSTRAYRRLAANLDDAHLRAAGSPRATFPAYLPVLRIDHVFMGAKLKVRHASVLRTELARVASDHLPLIVDFELVGADATRIAGRADEMILCPAG